MVRTIKDRGAIREAWGGLGDLGGVSQISEPGDRVGSESVSWAGDSLTGTVHGFAVQVSILKWQGGGMGWGVVRR